MCHHRVKSARNSAVPPHFSRVQITLMAKGVSLTAWSAVAPG